ncbi:hypothetical protein EZS27_024958 [termite gut metagenome]|uniref:Uncharacterized protein n=1 Tax=termite gut metagenome TaxID=433724 RepID=A0A5J4QVM4_9ZZZZ
MSIGESVFWKFIARVVMWYYEVTQLIIKNIE